MGRRSPIPGEVGVAGVPHRGQLFRLRHDPLGQPESFGFLSFAQHLGGDTSAPDFSSVPIQENNGWCAISRRPERADNVALVVYQNEALSFDLSLSLRLSESRYW